MEEKREGFEKTVNQPQSHEKPKQSSSSHLNRETSKQEMPMTSPSTDPISKLSMVDQLRLQYHSQIQEIQAQRQQTLAQSVHFGMLNSNSVHNCFLNAAIQQIWHVPVLRHILTHFQAKNDNQHMVSGTFQRHRMTQEQRLMHEIQVLFQQVHQDHRENKRTTLDPVMVRRELFKCCYGRENEPDEFKLYRMCDAVEMLDKFLNIAHHCLSNNLQKMHYDDPCDSNNGQQQQLGLGCYVHKELRIHLGDVTHCMSQGCVSLSAAIHSSRV